MAVRFTTDFHYTDRTSKARYVWLKYGEILRGSRILDVGADECHLKEHLDPSATYWGVGKGGNPDQEVDLESGELPFADGSYDCVLCLDVLEHLENAHFIFDELCRVARRHLVVSFPNPWAVFWHMLRARDYRPRQPLKFYGLPPERPPDRHRWFFSQREAREFIEHRAANRGMQILQMDNESDVPPRLDWKKRWAMSILLRPDVDVESLYVGPLWAVLEKPSA